MPCSFGKCQCGGPYLPHRYVMVILMCTAFIIMFVQRVSFNLIVSHMGSATNYSASPCGEESVPEAGGLGEWSDLVETLLLASFFIGYILMLLPAGFIADKFGGRLLCIVSVLCSSVLTLLLPVLSEHTFFWLVCICRVIIGAANASVFAAAATFISRWIPKKEWSSVCGAIFTSGSLGIILGGILGAMLEEHIAWQGIFYIWGGIGVLWGACALFWLYSEPNSHPSLTNSEIVYLDAEIKKKSDIPFNWKKMIIDPSLWGLGAAQFGHSFLAFMLITNMPSYYTRVLNIDTHQNVAFVIFPYIIIWIFAILSGVMADFFIHNKGWKPNLIRKIFYVISAIPVIFVLVIPILKCKSMGVLVMAAFGIIIMGPFFSSLRPNVLEMTCNHPGFITGVVGIFGAVSTIISQSIVDMISKDNTFKDWGIISYIVAAIVVITSIIYVLIGKAKQSVWDMTPEEQDQRQKEEEAQKAAKAAEAK